MEDSRLIQKIREKRGKRDRVWQQGGGFKKQNKMAAKVSGYSAEKGGRKIRKRRENETEKITVSAQPTL